MSIDVAEAFLLTILSACSSYTIELFLESNSRNHYHGNFLQTQNVLFKG